MKMTYAPLSIKMGVNVTMMRVWANTLDQASSCGEGEGELGRWDYCKSSRDLQV